MLKLIWNYDVSIDENEKNLNTSHVKVNQIVNQVL